MKKIFSLSLSLVAALMLAMWSSQAGAITLGTYDKGALVPVVIHNGSNVNTLVSITLHGSGLKPQEGKVTVYWTFFDPNSRHKTNGKLDITEDDMYPFDWKKESGAGLEKEEGYLVFATETGSISANAFMVDTAAHDAVYVPVLPLKSSDMQGIGTTAFEVTSAANGSIPGHTVDIRYWIDPAYNATTAVRLWSVCDVSKGTWSNPNSPGALYPLYVYNADELSKSVNIYLKNAELNRIDPSKLQGLPAGYVDGFIRFEIPSLSGENTDVNPDGTPGTCGTNNMLIFSYVDSSVIGAMQTLLAGEF